MTKPKIKHIYLLLILLGIYKAAVILLTGQYYSFDETIVTSIASQPFAKMFNTISYEPHPPGFYLLLKILPSQKPITQVSLIALNTALFATAIWYAHKNKVIKHYKIFWGILIFLTSNIFLHTSARVKQDIISVPIFLLSLFALLGLAKAKLQRNKIKYLRTQFFSSLILLFTGYLYFLISTLLFIISSLKYQVKVTLRYWLIFATTLLFYWELLLKIQIENNLSCFTWVHHAPNSLSKILYTSFYGYALSQLEIFTSIFTLMLVFLFFVGLLLLKNKRTQIIILSITIVSTAVFYIFKLYVRPRYVIFLTILVSFGVGKALNKLSLKTQLKLVFVLVVFSLPSLLTNHPIASYVNALQYPINPIKLIPFSASANYNKKFTNIDAETLSLEGKTIDKNNQTILPLLKQTKSNAWIYYHQITKQQEYYDPNMILLHQLEDNCYLKATKSDDYGKMYLFSDCFE